MTFKVKGQKALLKKIKKIADAPKVFDSVYKKVSLKALREYIRDTNRATGDAGRAWKVARVGESNYIVTNDKTTGGDNKIPIVQILNDGRKAIFPKKAKMLYIPLNEKGRSKSKGAVFGVDFVLAKKAKAFKGTKFIDKINKTMAKLLADSLVNKLRKVHRGQ